MSIQIKKIEFWIYGYLGGKMGEKPARAGSPVAVDGECQFVGDGPWSIFSVFLNNFPQSHFNGTSPSKTNSPLGIVSELTEREE